MMTFKQKILFTQKECDLILEKYIDKPIDEVENKDKKKYQSKYIDYNVDKWIIDRFINWIETEIDVKIDWNDSKSFNGINNEVYLQSYTIGDIFKKHHDNIFNRRYTCGLLLNDDFKGGNLNVYTHNDKMMKFNDVKGNCYFFDSGLYHEVNEIIEGNRSVVLIFFTDSHIIFKRNKLL
jgi:hypothetical protein